MKTRKPWIEALQANVQLWAGLGGMVAAGSLIADGYVDVGIVVAFFAAIGLKAALDWTNTQPGDPFDKQTDPREYFNRRWER